MPLIPAYFTNTVKPAYKKRTPARIITAMKKATGFSQSIDMGKTAMGGTPTTKQGIPALAQSYVSIWKKRLPASLAAKKEAKAEHALIKGAITAGGKHGMGGWQSGDFNSYAGGLGNLFKKRLLVNLMSIKEGKLKDTFEKEQIFRGSGVAPDYTPDISGIT